MQATKRKTTARRPVTTSRTWSCISAPSTRTRNPTSRSRPSIPPSIRPNIHHTHQSILSLQSIRNPQSILIHQLTHLIRRRRRRHHHLPLHRHPLRRSRQFPACLRFPCLRCPCLRCPCPRSPCLRFLCLRFPCLPSPCLLLPCPSRPAEVVRRWPSAGTTRHVRQRATTTKTGMPGSGRTTSPAGTRTPNVLTAARRRRGSLLTSPPMLTS